MIFRTLFSRVALTLFFVLSLVGLLLVQMLQHSSVMYQQEVTQKLNVDLAQFIIDDYPVLSGGKANDEVLDDLFHQLMVINPSIELYCLDIQGNIVGYSAPEGKVKRKSIAVEPILAFLQEPEYYPIKGDDPRNESGYKVFSAAEIIENNQLQGYLYIVLGGEQYDNVVTMIGESFIFDSTLVILALALLAALIAGLVIFSYQTRRLRRLGDVMKAYDSCDDELITQFRYPAYATSNDEIDELGQQFNEMADKINTQVSKLKKMDNLRREMVANVSHDLSTPLTAMRGYLETLLIQHQSIPPAEQIKYIETALSHSQHLTRLVGDLFELARLDSCESVVYAEPFSMCELVQDIAQKYQLEACDKGIDLTTHLNHQSPLIYGDLGMMQRVLENLLDNGLRHTPEKGRIDISVDMSSSHVVVKIADTGCGIPQEDIPRIFERFYQQDPTRTKGNNSGLGLAIVRRILELHHSAIEVTSELNKGTTFSFQMKLTQFS